jgi:hypothetical protein
MCIGDMQILLILCCMKIPRLYANYMPLYISKLRIRGFGHLQEVLKPIPCGYRGMAVYYNICPLSCEALSGLSTALSRVLSCALASRRDDQV